MAMNPLETKLKQLTLRSPLMTASGTSGTKREIANLRRSGRVLGALGAFVTKGVTLRPRAGNPEYRVVETRTGLLNSIGLQNSGAEVFAEKELPGLLDYNLPIIVNISAGSVEGFGELAAYLMEHDDRGAIRGVEINVSCPNLKEGGMAFGVNARLVERIVKAVGKEILIVTKMTPNVTDITEPARGAVAGGTDALSMINTVRGVAINIEERQAFLGNVYGGLSGPAIKPVGVYAVYECYKQIPECRDGRVPIIGIGGISNWRDALEYTMAGATALGVGTAWFVDNMVFPKIAQGLKTYLKKQGETSITNLIGAAHKT
jgi:dihydroorotate dehydrogenase (NAD+) catalytic subunit